MVSEVEVEVGAAGEGVELPSVEGSVGSVGAVVDFFFLRVLTSSQSERTRFI